MGDYHNLKVILIHCYISKHHGQFYVLSVSVTYQAKKQNIKFIVEAESTAQQCYKTLVFYAE